MHCLPPKINIDDAHIPLFRVYMADEADARATLHSGYIAQGPVVSKFEDALKKALGVPRVVAVNSATSGLTLALRLLGLPPGTRVACPPLTCFATVAAILANGLDVCWVDVNDRLEMDLDSLNAALTADDGPRAVVVVHWAGNPVSPLINDVARAHGVPVVEDCAHAFGARYANGRVVGDSPNVCVFSTQAIKHLTTGDGGFMTFPTDALYARAKRLRWYGIDRETYNHSSRDHYDIPEWGYKFNMNDVAAAIGLANLDGALRNVQYAREMVEAHYEPALKECVHVRPLVVQGGSARWVYTLLVEERDAFVDWMAAHGVEASIVHKRNDTYSCMRGRAVAPDGLPHLPSIYARMVSVPCGWWMDPHAFVRVATLMVAWDAHITHQLASST